MPENELKIIKGCQNGNLEKFRLLYDAYIQKIYRFIYFKTHNKEVAEDLTSVTFIKALEKINKFDPDKGSFANWIYQIARNTIIDHYRASKSHLDIEDAWDLNDDTDIERDVDFKDKIKEVEQYLKRLKPEQRDVVIMRVWQDMPYSEIAKITGKSEANSRMIFSRAVSTLKKDMPISLLLYLFLIMK